MPGFMVGRHRPGRHRPGVTISGAALAQGAYPSKPIRILVGFAPGGPSDIISRVVGAKMGEIMGAQFIIENKTGAGGAIATQEVARSAPDGYTLLNTPVATVANEFLSKTIRYEYGKDIIAVCPQAETANILVVSPSLGVKTVADLVKLAKEKPGVLQYATAGRGSATHLTSELFNMAAGIKTVAVHYRGGGDTVKDLLSGEVKMMFSSIAPVQDFVRDGRLIGLATTGPKRDAAFPDLPTIAESGYPGFDVRLWIGNDGAGGHPQGHHPKARRRQQKGARIARDPKGAGCSGLFADDRLGGGFRRLLPRRAREVGQGGHGNRNGQGVAESKTRAAGVIPGRATRSRVYPRSAP